MLFKILFIISLMSVSVYSYNTRRILYKTIIFDNDKNYGSEFDIEMSEEEKNMHIEIKNEENKLNYNNEILLLQKYQTMYKLLNYISNDKINIIDKLLFLKTMKKELDNMNINK